MDAFGQNTSSSFHQSLVVTSSAALNTTSSVPYQDTSIPRYFGIAIGIFAISVGSIGNLLTLIAIWNNKKLHKPFYMFIANLCLIDFLTAAVMMPFNVTSYITKTWPFGEQSFTCSFMAYFYYCCGYSSIMCLLAITVNRFVGVVIPKQYNNLFSKKRIIITILISWIFAPFCLAPVFFFKKKDSPESSSITSNGFAWNSKVSLCVFNIDIDVVEKYTQFIRILFQLVPLFIMIILYTKIFLTSKQTGQAVTNISLKTDTEPSFLERCRTYSGTLKRPNLQLSHLFNKVHMKKASPSVEDVYSLSLELDIRKNASSKLENSLSRHSSVKKYDIEKSPNSDSNFFRFEEPDDTERGGIDRIPPKERQNQTDSMQDGPRKNDEKNIPLSTQIRNQATINLPFHFHYQKEKCCSAPSSPISGVRKTINTRSLQTHNSLCSVNNSPNLLRKAPLANRRPLPCSGNSSPVSQRSSHFGRSNDKYSSIIRQEAKKRKLIDRRLLLVSFTICTTFTLLFLPSAIVGLIPGEKHPGVHMAASVVTWLNSCVNPIVYCFMNPKLREQYKLLLNKVTEFICRSKNNEHKMAPRSLRKSMHSHQKEKI